MKEGITTGKLEGVVFRVYRPIDVSKHLHHDLQGI